MCQWKSKWIIVVVLSTCDHWSKKIAIPSQIQLILASLLHSVAICHYYTMLIMSVVPNLTFTYHTASISFSWVHGLPASNKLLIYIQKKGATIYVTGFAKGVFHTHPIFWLWRTITWCSSKIQSWNFHNLLHYVGALNRAICRSIALTHVKLWIVEAWKSDVCGRPLFANPVTYIRMVNCLNIHHSAVPTLD